MKVIFKLAFIAVLSLAVMVLFSASNSGHSILKAEDKQGNNESGDDNGDGGGCDGGDAQPPGCPGADGGAMPPPGAGAPDGGGDGGDAQPPGCPGADGGAMPPPGAGAPDGGGGAMPPHGPGGPDGGGGAMPPHGPGGPDGGDAGVLPPKVEHPPVDQMVWDVERLGLEMEKPEGSLWRFLTPPKDNENAVARLAKYPSETADPEKDRSDVDIYVFAYNEYLVFSFEGGLQIPVANVEQYSEAMYETLTTKNYEDIKDADKPSKARYKISKDAKEYFEWSFTGRNKTSGANDIWHVFFKAGPNVYEIRIYATAGHFKNKDNKKEVENILKKGISIEDPAKKKKKKKK